jgi:HD-like signal output (HDOD) protein
MEGTETPGTLDIKTLTPEKLLKRLRNALQRDGDFPASAKVVSELKRLTSDPKTTANQITEVILKEPSLGTARITSRK